MKACSVLLATAAQAAMINVAPGEEFSAISNLQVNNRTLLNEWALFIEYAVDAKAENSAKDNTISITTILRNENVLGDFNRRIKSGEVFQTYFSIKDPEKEQEIEIQIPAPTADLENTVKDLTVKVPFYENFVCSMEYNVDTKNVTPYPETRQTVSLATTQSCGNIPLHKWSAGLYDKVGQYNDRPCTGNDWTIDLEKTKFIESEDGSSFEARCTFTRSFSAGALREIKFDEDLNWMAGYNIYHSKESVYRYMYGFSYESDKRNSSVVLKAGATMSETLLLGVTMAAASLSMFF